jgi:hypothetical protein
VASSEKETWDNNIAKVVYLPSTVWRIGHGGKIMRICRDRKLSLFRYLDSKAMYRFHEGRKHLQ